MFHHLCPMPISTDGVLLGAWADVTEVHRVLDIGTGCGLIALMIAQRNSRAVIDAIDIHEGAVAQAKENFANSPWGDRMQCTNSDFFSFAKECKSTYDLIVSNPPFFTEDTMSPDKARANARNAVSMPFHKLIGYSKGLLAHSGKLCIITPYSIRDEIMSIAKSVGLSIIRATLVKPNPDSSPHRILWQLGNDSNKDQVIDEIAIEISRHQYTQEYISLTKDFYLKM